MEKATIREAYVNYYLEHGRRPVSVYSFCQLLGMAEPAFYEVYSSFEGIEQDFWLFLFNETLKKLKEDETYPTFSAREKLLTFYFLWVQMLLQKRSYILLQNSKFPPPGIHPRQLESFRSSFYTHIRELIKEAYGTGEVKERKHVSDQYVHGFWLQALFVLRYWINDSSERFEMTDAAIEKAVDLSFKLIGSGTLDSILDFGKFVFAGK
jgi:Tetracyclin repressor-like, C-terminal domain